MPEVAQTAEEAFNRYKSYLDADALIQSGWHRRDDDGRDLACGLGALGPNVNSPGDCPAQVMPPWLAQMVPWFFDNQDFEAAKDWGLRFYAELKRLGGAVPFSVIHDWQANVVGPMAVKAAEDQGRDAAAHKALEAMQKEALSGKKFTADEWRPVLKAAFLDIYKFRYHANAYANDDADAYAYAYANADANAYAGADAGANEYRGRLTLLAEGMIDCLKRVPA